MSLGQRLSKTVLQVAGISGWFVIDLAADAAIGYGQSLVYKKYGME
jgi:hypothetical protein